jgi:hypothetical protein
LAQYHRRLVCEVFRRNDWGRQRIYVLLGAMMTGMIVTAGLSAWGILVLFACALCRAAGDADRRTECRASQSASRRPLSREPNRSR